MEVIRSTTVDLRLGDCLEGMRAMAAGSVGLVVTSPPYNLGIDYATFKDTAPRDQYLEWCGQWSAAVKHVLDDGGSFFLNVAGSPKDPLMPHQLAILLSEQFVLQNTFHWIKSITVATRGGEPISAGHFKPINSKRYVNDCHEYLFHFTKTGDVPLDRKAAGVPYQDKSNISRWGHTEGEDKRCRGNNWFVPYDTIVSRDKDRPHPASFPIGLVEQCIAISGRAPSVTLLDPFSGIGSTAAAAVRQGLAHFIGFEIDEGYNKVAWERVRKEAETLL